MLKEPVLYAVLILILIAGPFTGGSIISAKSFAAQETTDWAWHTQLSGGRIEDSSPTLADLDNDRETEIVVGTTADPSGASSTLAVLESDGSVKWEREIEYPIRSSPMVGDISSPLDGIPEIVITTGGDAGPPAEGSVIAYNHWGNRLWEYETDDAEGTGTPNGNWSSPTLGDVDNDGDMEIVFGSWDRNIYMLDHNGNYLWHYHVGDTVWSTAALADFDKNGSLEILIGTDIAGGGTLPDGYEPTDGGFVLILDKDGNKLARRQMNETIYSSPAVGDVNGDGELEVFVGTGRYYFNEGNYTQPYVYGFNVKTSGLSWELQDLPGWPQPVAYPGMSSPALADLDDDDDLEIIIGTGDKGGCKPNECSGDEEDPDCYGAIYAWQHSGLLVTGFPVWPLNNREKNAFIRSSPTVADIDGDGEMEIAFSMLWDVNVIDESGNQEFVFHTPYSLFASPALGDLDNDGQTDIVIGGANLNDDEHGYVYNFELDSGTWDGTLDPWPMFHRDAQNTGLYPMPPRLEIPSVNLYLMHQYGSGGSEHSQLNIDNLGGFPFEWQVSSTPSEVTTDPSSGTIPPGSEDQMTITISTTGYTTGTHDLGDIVIAATADGDPVDGSPFEIPITLYVGDVHSVYLPLTIRSIP